MAGMVELRRNGQIVGHARICGQGDVGLEGDWIGEHSATAREYDGPVYREEVSMDKDKHKAALDALSELIRGELAGDDRARFSRVGRLAVIGQKLMLEMAPRASDVDEDDPDADIIGEYGDGPFQRRRRRGALVLGGGNDQQQMVRETLAMIAPAMGGLQQHNVARRRESAARELNELLSAREALQGTVANAPAVEKLTKRIDAILAAMGEEDKPPQGDEDGLSMVPAVDVRRHQARPDFGGFNAGDPYGPFPHGEGGGAGALRAGDEARGAPEGVGGFGR